MSDDAGQTITNLSDEIPLDNMTTDDNQSKDEIATDIQSDKEELFTSSICTLGNFIWIFFLFFGVYDYVTDMLVARDWSEFRNLCPRFRQYDGHLCEESEFESNGKTLLLLTTIGFILSLIFKSYELYVFIQIHRYCSSKQELRDYEFKIFRMEIYAGWLPLIIEDIASLVIVTNTLTKSAEMIEGIDPSLVQQSMIVTAASLILNYINFMRIFLYSRRDQIKMAFSKCRKYMCAIFWILMGLGLLIVIIICFSGVNEIYNIDQYESEASTAYIEMGQRGHCEQANPHPDIGYQFNHNYWMVEEWKSIPYKTGESVMCNISSPQNNYRPFTPECTLLYEQSTDYWSFNCTFRYPNDWNSPKFENCSVIQKIVSDGECNKFSIPWETCGDYTIPCNFGEGNASFYICLDYCYYNFEL
eukprot:452050_1